MDLDEKEELLFSWKFMLSRQYSLAEGGGISVLDLVSGEHSVVQKGGESSSPHGLVVLEGSIFFSDTKVRKIKVVHRHTDSGEADVNVFAGNGVAQRKYGLANVTSFGQPSSIVAEGNSLFVCDTGGDAISLITSINALHLMRRTWKLLVYCLS